MNKFNELCNKQMNESKQSDMNDLINDAFFANSNELEKAEKSLAKFIKAIKKSEPSITDDDLKSYFSDWMYEFIETYKI